MSERQRIEVNFRDTPAPARKGSSDVYYWSGDAVPAVQMFPEMPGVIIVNHDDGREVIPVDVIRSISLRPAAGSGLTP